MPRHNVEEGMADFNEDSKTIVQLVPVDDGLESVLGAEFPHQPRL